MKQCTKLVCKQTFSFKVDGEGRVTTFREGQEFWITNTETHQKNSGSVNVARKGQKWGYSFTAEQVTQFFVEKED
jgi:hypothetical protein